jgi:colicin import membrane protein
MLIRLEREWKEGQQAMIAREVAAKEQRKREEDERLAKKLAEEEKRRQEAKLKKALEAQRLEQKAILKQFGSDPKAKAAHVSKDRITKDGGSGGAEIGDRSGVLADYSAAIRARILSRVKFDPVRAPGNPETTFEVVQLPTGEITRVTLLRPSGNPAWDTAVERAIQQSNPLPKASDGSVEPRLILSFRPAVPQ